MCTRIVIIGGVNILTNNSWEELEAKPVPGQWEYFTRPPHMPPAQEPAK